MRRKFVFKELFQLQMLKLSLSFFLLSHIFNRNLFIYFYLTLFPHNLSHFILEASTKKWEMFIKSHKFYSCENYCKPPLSPTYLSALNKINNPSSLDFENVIWEKTQKCSAAEISMIGGGGHISVIPTILSSLNCTRNIVN